MRAGRLVTLFVTVLVLAGTAGAHATSARPTDDLVARCAVSLDCRWTDFDRMDMAQRMEFVLALQRDSADRIVPGFDRWAAIYGVTWFFRDFHLGAPGSWVSTVNAVGLEAVERATAQVLGLPGGDYGNPGTHTWADYLDALREGRLEARSAHDAAWSRGEQAAIDHAQQVAVSHHRPPTPQEQVFLQNSDLLRWAMRNEPAVLDGLTSAGGDRPTAIERLSLFHWLTDVRDPVPWRHSAEVSWKLAHGDLLGLLPAGANLLLRYLDAAGAADTGLIPLLV